MQKETSEDTDRQHTPRTEKLLHHIKQKQNAVVLKSWGGICEGINDYETDSLKSKLCNMTFGWGYSLEIREAKRQNQSNLLFCSLSLVHWCENQYKSKLSHPGWVFQGNHEVVRFGGFVWAWPCPARPPHQARQDLYRPPVWVEVGRHRWGVCSLLGS